MGDHIEAHTKHKRRKLNEHNPVPPILSASDLHHLLTTGHSSQSDVKVAVKEFKEFLNVIRTSGDNEDRAKKLQILKVYSQEQAPSNQQLNVFPDLFTIWFSAVETNNESILSSLPSVLALYLNTISSHIQFRAIGLSLCKCLLLEVKCRRLLDRGLTATKTKEHLISPCLRLLTEIVSFDGGEVATLLYSKRDTTFRRLEVFLEQRSPHHDAPDDLRQKPTLRHIAQSYLLANLKFQSASAKVDIIAQGKILRSSLQSLKIDSADIICDTLISLENEIVRSPTLTKGIKSRLFNSSNLSSLASLYSVQDAVEEKSSRRSVREQLDVLLRLVCTQQEVGILLPQNGWYPLGSNHDRTLAITTDPNRIDVTVTPCPGFNHKERYAIKNGVLSTFILALRPERDKLQASLLLDIFRAAPELVADYFSKKSNFIVDPKDTPEWLGQSAFLFSLIQLPVPAYCGSQDMYSSSPPPSSVVLESILPRPLDRVHTTRSLNLNHEVITLFAVRAVTVAFQKLRRVLEVYRAASFHTEEWKQAASDLLSAFSRRCPLAKDVLSTFQRTSKADEQLRGSIIELLANYYQVLPHLILLEKFDTSLILIDTIKRVADDVHDQSPRSSRFSELERLLNIAQMSPDTRWWQKPDSLPYSAFTSILKAILEAGDQSILAIPSIKHLLGRIATEEGLVRDMKTFESLVISLTAGQDWRASPKTFSFFDNCACRIARQPVHYEDLAAEMNGSGSAICLLPVCVAEQWAFVIGIEDSDDQKNIAEWISRLLVLLMHVDEDRDMMQQIHSQIVDLAKDTALTKNLISVYQKMLTETISELPSEPVEEVVSSSDIVPKDGVPTARIAPRVTFEPLLDRLKSMEGLERLTREDVEETVANGRLGRLCRALSSEVEETRMQGFMTLQEVIKQIELSSYSEKGPLYVLIGEFAETARLVGLASPFASIFTEFAAAAVETLSQPSHFLYGKINKFLQRGPVWKLSKFATYWTETILLCEPEDDNGHAHETTWLLDLLIRGLRDDQDMELYRRSNVFERVLAFYGSKLCSDAHGKQILELVHRSIKLGSGLTLITRLGIENWFVIEQEDGKHGEIFKELGQQLDDRVDTSVSRTWKLPATPRRDVS